jgi:site-specific recombinase XerD
MTAWYKTPGACERRVTQAIAARDHAAFSTMNYADLRIEEVTALTVDDLSLARGAEEVRVAKEKGNKERLVALGPRLRRSLRRYLRQRDVLMPADVKAPLPASS